MFHKLLFCTLNILLIIHWAGQLFREEVERQFGVWDEICEELEREKGRIDGVLGEECRVQVLRETSTGMGGEDSEGGNEVEGKGCVAVDGHFDVPVPDAPKHRTVEKRGSPSFPTSPMFGDVKKFEKKGLKSPSRDSIGMRMAGKAGRA